MMRSVLTALLATFVCLATGNAATLTLKDGSVVRGEVSALRNGVYTVTSQSLGKIRVVEADIQSISYNDSAGPDAQGGNSNNAREIQQLQRGLAGDSVTMSMISELQNDPQLKAILADPEIMRAVSSGDLTTLMANEKFMALMNHADIKAITRQVTGQ